MSLASVLVVDTMLDHAVHARWDQLHTVLAEDFVIVEPDSLPYGGSHHGVDGYRALMQAIGALFELKFEPVGCHAVGDNMVVLRLNVRFAARATGRQVRLPVVELFTLRAGRIARSEVFLFDTAALLATLGADLGAP